MVLVWTSGARQQRQKAIDYIAEDNPIAALDQLDEIERQVDHLIQEPEMGRSGRLKGTRELIINRTPFVVVYRVRPRAQRIELIRFVHESQKWIG